MQRDVKNKLEETCSRIFFNELKIEILKDVIILVAPDLNLLEVATACANDDTETFSKWIANGDIKKPSIEEIDLWKGSNTEFDCSIVKPFVFLQKAFIN